MPVAHIRGFASRAAFLVGFALVAFAVMGCGAKAPEYYPVTGKVVGADGKPLDRATVVLHPVSSSDPNAVKPRGTAGPDGSFALTSNTTGDGALAGEYRVTVELWLSSGRADEPPTNRLPAKYANPETSGLTATINTAPTELQTITLKR